MKKLNILILNLRDIKNPDAGGLEVRLHELAKRLVQDNNKVTLLCSKFKSAKERDNIDGVDIIRLGRKYTFTVAIIFYFLFKLKCKNYDLVIEDVDKVPVFTPLFVKKPVLVCCSQLNGKIYFKELLFPFSAIAFLLEQKLMPLVYRNNHFVVDSESTKKELISIGINKNKIFLVNNGLNHKNYEPIHFSKKKSHQILVLSRLKKYKSIQYVIRAIPQIIEALPKVKLIIAGCGDYEYQLKKLVNKLKLRNIVFLKGRVSEKEKVKLLQQSALLVNYSFKEGWGINVIEANACGTPVVASNVSGLCDSVIDGKTGVLVPYGDTNALSNAIISLLSNDNMRKKMSKNAVIHARKYDWDITYEKFKRCINRIMECEN